MSKENKNIANLDELQNVLGVKLQRVIKSDKTLSEQGQVMAQVKDAMHKLLIEKFPQYYKNIETDVIVTSKEGEHTLKRISGYHLLFKKIVDVGDQKQDGFKICKPTTYVKGGNSYSCLYFREIGKTTYKK